MHLTCILIWLVVVAHKHVGVNPGVDGVEILECGSRGVVVGVVVEVVVGVAKYYYIL